MTEYQETFKSFKIGFKKKIPRCQKFFELVKILIATDQQKRNIDLVRNLSLRF